MEYVSKFAANSTFKLYMGYPYIQINQFGQNWCFQLSTIISSQFFWGKNPSLGRQASTQTHPNLLKHLEVGSKVQQEQLFFVPNFMIWICMRSISRIYMTPLWSDKSIDWHWYLNLIQCEFATVKGVFFLSVSSKWNDVSLPPTQSDEISKISQLPFRAIVK